MSEFPFGDSPSGHVAGTREKTGAGWDIWLFFKSAYQKDAAGLSCPAALLKLSAAAARAGIIAAGPRRPWVEGRRRFAPPGCQSCKRFARVEEETLHPGTEIVEPRLAIRCIDEAILGAAAIAHGQNFAFPAIPRKGAALCFSETSLRFAIQQATERCFAYVAQPVIPVDKVIAREKIAVVFQYRNLAAGFTEHT